MKNRWSYSRTLLHGVNIKPEAINTATSSAKLKLLDIHAVSPPVEMPRCICGSQSKHSYKIRIGKTVVKSFMKQVEETYVACGKCLQANMPIDNPFLKSIAAISPDARGHSLTFKHLGLLPVLEMYDLEIRRL